MNLQFVVFAIWPYAAVVCFVVGHIWRWRYDQFGWTSRTSQLLERRWLALASPLFHVGALLVLGGHIVGIMVPAKVTEKLGIPEHLYHLTAVTGGVAAGLVLLAGLVILIIRRVVFRVRLRLVTTRGDVVLYVLLGVIILLGFTATAWHNLIGPGYDYRETISVWFRSLFTGAPNVELMASAPVLYQCHAAVGFALIAIWPFTRLVHVWSVPLGYLIRPYVVYRGKRLTSGRV